MEKRQDSILLLKVKSGGEEADGRARDSVVALGRGWGVAQPADAGRVDFSGISALPMPPRKLDSYQSSSSRNPLTV